MDETTGTALIHFTNVSKRYPNGHQALLNISFALDKGELAFLTGHSGAGKSTLLKLLALIERPTGGEVLLSGQNLMRVKKSGIAALRRHIGLIFQDPQLLPDRSILDNVALPLVIGAYRYPEIQKRARAALDKVGLIEKENLLPIMLSAGERQRVGIARAIVAKPPVILADEPTGNLDPDLSADIMQLFEQLNQLGTTMLIASHDVALINQLHHRRLTLDKGVLVEDEAGDCV
mgnify:CR=1 FL=1